ncbi:MAG: hypothetical protein Unbinned5179contig1001_16 [Prokaryotic dsDNA virus sp.]|nr:MAG: hypothetical protein Unbinned5179contig1001_16 [Prokaryotic dsDNA virus sp.]|tara:strand:- start:1316 stop:1555 length:240 start_codon:yes stop_codon:yes gene_type:complete
MLITITTKHGQTLAFRASDVAAVRQHVPGDPVSVHFNRGHALAGSWSVAELHAPGLCSMLRPTLEGVIDAINITTTEGD